MQVDPGLTAVDPTLCFQALSGTFRDFQRLKLKYDELLLSFAFNCNLVRHYNMGPRSRYLGAEVPAEELNWQDPIPTGGAEAVQLDPPRPRVFTVC